MQVKVELALFVSNSKPFHGVMFPYCSSSCLSGSSNHAVIYIIMSADNVGEVT